MIDRTDGQRAGKRGARILLISIAALLIASGAALSATRPHGSHATNRQTVYAPSPLTWGNPVALHPSGAGLMSVMSCPTSAQCTTVDSTGVETTFDPSSPGSPTSAAVDTAAANYFGGSDVTGISCPTAAQCTLVDILGNEVTFNPSSPGSATAFGIQGSNPNGLVAVSCPSTTQCDAIDGVGNVLTFNPQSPSLPAPVSLGSSFTPGVISCPTATQCTVVGVIASSSGEGEITFDPTHPGSPSPVAFSGSVFGAEAISCVSAGTQCTTVDFTGDETAFNPKSPSPKSFSLGSFLPSAISCASGTSNVQCTVVNGSGGELTFNPASPGSPAVHQLDGTNPFAAIACTSTSQCAAVDTQQSSPGPPAGREVTFNPNAVGSPTAVTIDGGSVYAGISCPSGNQCTAVDNTGHEVSFDPTSPGSPTTALVDSGQQLNGVSCPAASQCNAVDSSGQFVTFNPSSVGTPTVHKIDSGHVLQGISCFSTSQCTAVDNQGNEFMFNPTNVGSPTAKPVEAGTALTDVACPAANQCTAVDNNGNEMTFDPSSPGTPKLVSVTGQPGATQRLTCPSMTQCTVVAGYSFFLAAGPGTEATFNPKSPGTPTAAGIDESQDVSCATASLCAAVGSGGATASTNPAGGTAQWSWPSAHPDANPLTAVSCAPGGSLCAAVDSDGYVTIGQAGGTPPSPVNIAPPTIGGTAEVGQTLYASTGRWTNNPTSHAYQWQDCNSAGTSCSNVPANGNSSSYVAVQADLGKTLRVNVTATNGGGSQAASSAPTSAVAVGPPTPISPPSISGVATQGQTLTESPGQWTNSPTITIQWRRCNAGGAQCSSVHNANTKSYTLTSSDVGHTIDVQETAVNGVGPANKPSTSTPTGVVAGPPPPPPVPVNASVPTITGAAVVGQTLSENHGVWTNGPNAYAYKWEDCDTTGAACSVIGGAIGQTYTITSSDLGHTIRVYETASNAGGSGSAAPSAATAVVQPQSGGGGHVSVPSAGHPHVSGTTVSLQLACSQGSGACVFKVTLSVVETLRGGKVIAVLAKSGKTTTKTVKLASITLTLQAGQTKTVKLSVNGSGIRLLTTRHHFKALVTIAAGGRTIATPTISLTAPKKKKHG